MISKYKSEFLDLVNQYKNNSKSKRNKIAEFWVQVDNESKNELFKEFVQILIDNNLPLNSILKNTPQNIIKTQISEILNNNENKNKDSILQFNYI